MPNTYTRPARISSALVELPADQPWQKLPGERGREAFEAFLALGPTRTLRAVAELPGITARPGTINSWSSRFSWAERAAAHDAHFATKAGQTLANLQSQTLLDTLATLQGLLGPWVRSLDGVDPLAEGVDVEKRLDGVLKILDKITKLFQTGGSGGTTVNVGVQVNNGPSAEAQLATIMRVLQHHPAARDAIQGELAREFDAA